MAEPNCFGNEVQSGCVFYDGPDIPQLGIANGDNLTTVIGKIVNAQAPISPDTIMPNTDDIITTSLIRSTGSLCASSIVNTELKYSLSTNAAGSVLTYDMVNIRRDLPSGYELAIARVRIIGTPVGGISLVTDSRSMATSLSIPINRYPVTAEFLLRITSPCGQIDLTKTIELSNPSLTGSFKTDLDKQDLSPNQGQVRLTQQLNNIESRLQVQEGRTKDSTATKSELETQSAELATVKDTVDNPDSLNITYIKDTAITTSQLTEIVTNLYSEIKTLTDKTRTQEQTITALKNQVNSL